MTADTELIGSAARLISAPGDGNKNCLRRFYLRGRAHFFFFSTVSSHLSPVPTHLVSPTSLFMEAFYVNKHKQTSNQPSARKEEELQNWRQKLEIGLSRSVFFSSLDITSPHFSLFLTFPLHHISPSSSSSSLVLQSHSSSSTSSFSHSSRHHFHLLLLRLFPPASPFVPPAQSCSSKPDYICHTVSWGPPIRANRS